MPGTVQRGDDATLFVTTQRANAAAPRLAEQQRVAVAPFWAAKYKREVARNWDLFYKRNETRFFKDRHWLERELPELFAPPPLPPPPLQDAEPAAPGRRLLEVGCGVGNLVVPLMSALPPDRLAAVFACDFSPRAISLINARADFDAQRCRAFVADIVHDDLATSIPEPVDIVTMIFVLSAIPPDLMAQAVRSVAAVMAPGALLFFRDYGLYDEAQLRFQPGHRLDDSCYVRQDGTLSFYFSIEHVRDLFVEAGFDVVENEYHVHQTSNAKLNVTFERVFVQAKLRKI